MTGSSMGDDYQPDLDELIPLTMAAKISGLTPGRFRQLIRAKEIWGRKLGRDWFTTEKAVRDYLARDRRPGRKTNSNS